MVSEAEYFKKRREELGITISEVSLRINVKPEFLEAIENGDEKVFASGVYRRGFVKLYARYLGLDEQYALALDRRTHKLENSKNIQSLEKKAFFGRSHVRFSLVIFVLILISAILSVLIYVQYTKFNTYPEIYLKKPINSKYLGKDGKTEFTVNYTSEVDSIDIVGSVEKDTLIYINDRLQTIDTLGEFSINDKVLFSGANRFKIVAENKIGKKTTVYFIVFSK